MTVQSRGRRRIAQIAGFAGVIIVFAAAIWIDVATGLWQQAVILSGIAAGLLTFLLTALFFERWLAGAEHRRWYPVTHLALTDLLHALGDEERSRYSRGEVEPRALRDSDDHGELLETIHRDRRAITHALSRWAGFLAASADVQTIMDHVADLALLLDAARDAAIDAESSPEDAAAQRTMHDAAAAVNRSIAAAVAEIEQALEAFARAQ